MNSRRKAVLKTLTKYFVEKGKILSPREYKKETDTPIRAVLVPRYIGSWARLPKLIQNTYPEDYEKIVNPPKPEVEEPVAKKVKKVEKPEVKKEVSDE